MKKRVNSGLMAVVVMVVVIGTGAVWADVIPIDTIIVNSTNPNPVYTNEAINVNCSYLIEATGIYNYGATAQADAGYAKDGDWPNVRTDLGIHPTTIENHVGVYATGVTSLLVDFGSGIQIADWGEFKNDHVYTYKFVATSNNLGFVISDWWGTWYGSPWDNQGSMHDNSGFLTVKIYHISLKTIEITGPNEVAENSQAQYKAIAHYDDDSTRDVTALANWSVEPNDIANVNAGLLTTEPIDLPQDITITAQYSEGDVNESAQKQVSVLTICPSGSALEFDGVNDYVDLGNDNSLKPPLPVTISAWIKLPVLDSYGQIIGLDDQSSRYYGIWIHTGTGGIAVGYGDGGTHGPHSRRSKGGVGPALEVDVWYHITTVVTNAIDMDIYINATNVAGTYSGTGGNLTYSNGKSSIGSRLGLSSEFNGAIDEVSIWNRVLTAEQIRTLMHTRPDTGEPNLVAYWDFDEGEGQVAHDSSGNGNNGFLGSDPCDIDNSDPNWGDSVPPVGICYPVAVDIKPGSCPNPLNLASRGVLSAAILGSENFDVTTIDPGSIFLEGVPTIRTNYEDVGTEVVDGNECDCTEQGPDGYIDLTLKFKTQEVVEAIMTTYGILTKDQTLILNMNGELYDGTSIEGTDCVNLVGNVSKWLLAKGSDINEDGIVNILDFAELASYWLESQ